MKTILLSILFLPLILSGQIDSSYVYKTQFNDGLYLNNKSVETFLNEYLTLLESNDINIDSYLEELQFILVEPPESDISTLKNGELGKVDFEKGVIILSRTCLLDLSILKATSFREISHFLGVPYELDGVGIMSLNKPEGYSYGWILSTCENDIIEFEFDYLVRQVRNHLR